jgi:hypothetical protein
VAVGVEVPIQALLSEILFRMVRRDRSVLEELFDDALVEEFLQIDASQFTDSIRRFVNTANRLNSKCHSVWCDAITFNNVPCHADWVDIGIEHITFWCQPEVY